ncbi:AlkZ-related protein [Butyrivibrio sp. NC2002]|uniref:AlkZ-related protein n=1 Tax=Butyrivibrio sp. NC2002 TaxID=1410610 RepID=UPI00056AB96D|nr:hypothetical protein [Butyrivibrio sp. NC2002]
MIIDEIRKRSDLVDLVNEIGFLPFFSCRIEGFSLEENVSYEAWYQGRWKGRVHWDAWDWKGEVLREKELVYGKFFEKKAGFISMKLWPDFCNYRRDGYDFDARFDDGIAAYKDKGVVDFINGSGATLTREIKNGLNYKKGGNKGFETVITRLQMQTYVVPVDYEYSKRKSGDEYGWGNCRYDIAENYRGDKLCRSAYKRSPEESLDRIIKHIRKALPRMDEDELRTLLGCKKKW